MFEHNSYPLALTVASGVRMHLVSLGRDLVGSWRLAAANRDIKMRNAFWLLDYKIAAFWCIHKEGASLKLLKMH